MMGFILKKIFGTQNERFLRRIRPLVAKVNSLEEKTKTLSDEDLRAKTDEFKRRLGEGQTLEDLLPEAFAVVREASRRRMNMRHFDVQIIGGIVLHKGTIAEMVTGEGKTLVATLAAYLNALTGKGVHIVTVNDYLAMRDRNWMGPIFEFLGLDVGVIQHDMLPQDRKKAYAADITYGTNNEFGFDYLRDNMVIDKEDMVQRPLHYTIVDELDSILIDEARTPLIISGPVDEVNTSYQQMNPLVARVHRKQKGLIDEKIDALEKVLKAEDADKISELLYIIHKGSPKNQRFLQLILNDASLKSRLDKSILHYESKTMQHEREQMQRDLFYTFDEKTRDVVFMSKGEDEFAAEGIDFILGDIEELVKQVKDNGNLSPEEAQAKELEVWQNYTEQKRKLESIKQLLKAYVLFHNDVDYVINENKIVIIDEFTGRMMPGRRFSDGIHEAIEAKENLEVQRESQTLATITFQNYFKMYEKLAGMTGTAQTEAQEFKKIYKLDVIVVPTNKPLRRINTPDIIYKTEREKFDAVCRAIAEHHKEGHPVLVGTASIAKNEKLSQMLTKYRIPHNILNAKQHDKEADIIKRAGQKYAVTIATNMAGRGTDIVLGEGVAEGGGLQVIGTERHESRRIDNQLRGRAGRQGDPGASIFYLSLEDDLMRVFGSDRIKTIMEKLGMEEGQELQHPLITRSIATAQRRVESQNFEIRKHLLEYDNVMNKQRTVIYEERRSILYSEALSEHIFDIADEIVGEIIAETNPTESDEEGMHNFLRIIETKFMIALEEKSLNGTTPDSLHDMILERIKLIYQMKKDLIPAVHLLDFERMMILSIIDSRWKHHLHAMDDLRDGIGLRAYGQRDPLVEYQHEAYRMFEELIRSIKEEVVEKSLKAVLVNQKMKEGVFQSEKERFEHPEFSREKSLALSNMRPGPSQVPPPSREGTYQRHASKVGRNDPCPCGSGKKYKKCCGQ